MDFTVDEIIHKNTDREICRVTYQGKEMCAKIFNYRTTSEIYYPQREFEVLNSVQGYKKVVKCFGSKIFPDSLSKTRRYAIFMEYCSKKDLVTYMAQRKKQKNFFTSAEIWKHLKEFVHTLRHMQEKQICHRDIKPQNIFVNQDDELLLGDFGEGKHAVGEKHTFRGTHFFLSPKLRMHHKAYMGSNLNIGVDHNIYKSDVYSLGVVFLCMNSMEEFNKDLMLELQIEEKLNKISDLVLREVIVKMVEEDEDRRPDFVELERIIQESGVEAVSGCEKCSLIRSKVDPANSTELISGLLSEARKFKEYSADFQSIDTCVELDFIDFEEDFEIQTSVWDRCLRCYGKIVVLADCCRCSVCMVDLCSICKLHHLENEGCVRGIIEYFICVCGCTGIYRGAELFMSCSNCGELCRICLKSDTSRSHLLCAKSLLY